MVKDKVLFPAGKTAATADPAGRKRHAKKHRGHDMMGSKKRKEAAPMKKEYKKPAVIAEGNYSACMSSCGKLVNNVNSACGH